NTRPPPIASSKVTMSPPSPNSPSSSHTSNGYTETSTPAPCPQATTSPPPTSKPAAPATPSPCCASSSPTISASSARTTPTRNNLASAYLLAGHTAEAITEYQQVLADRRGYSARTIPTPSSPAATSPPPTSKQAAPPTP